MIERLALGIAGLVVALVATVAVAAPDFLESIVSPEGDVEAVGLDVTHSPDSHGDEALFAATEPGRGEGQVPSSRGLGAHIAVEPPSSSGAAGRNGDSGGNGNRSDGVTATTTPSRRTTNPERLTETTSAQPRNAAPTTTPTTVTTAPTTVTTKPTSTSTSSDGRARIDGDIRLRPGDNVTAQVSNSPNGTVFVFSPGVYKGVSISPKSAQQFLGEPGAVLDGNGAQFAFKSSASDVVIDGLEMTNYKPPSRNGVVQGGIRWIVRNNHIHHNAEIGIHSLDRGHVIDNNIHHNGRYGISGGGFKLIEGNEIAYNANVAGLTGDSGGTKFVLTTDLIIRGNHVHSNFSHGIWVDIDNVNVLTENNRVVSNRGNGIFYEIGCGPGGVIRNNHVEANGFPDRFGSWIGDTAGIVVSMTQGVEIYGNTLVKNTKGIGGIEWDHPGVGAVKRCSPHLKDLYVHDNVITQSGGAAAGIDANTNRDKVWTSWGNRFRSNTYNLSDGARFRWNGTWASREQWTSYGNS